VPFRASAEVDLDSQDLCVARMAEPRAAELNIARIARWCRDHWAGISVAVNPALRSTKSWPCNPGF